MATLPGKLGRALMVTMLGSCSGPERSCNGPRAPRAVFQQVVQASDSQDATLSISFWGPSGVQRPVRVGTHSPRLDAAGTSDHQTVTT